LRTTRLAFVNKQIEKLYGPLYILTQSNNEAWTYFTGRYFKRRKTIFSEAPLKIPDVDIWRLWITTVFQPLNIKIESAIVNNPQLLMGPGIPPVFQQFITHTESYRPLIETWKPSDKSNEANYVEQEKNVGAFNYPKDIIQCVSVSYQTLQKRKEALENFFNVVAAFSSEPEQPCVCKFEVADTEEKKSGKCREYKEANYVLPKQDAK
jgi:hypothetical protein